MTKHLLADLQIGNIKPPTDAFSKGSEQPSGVNAATNLEKILSNVIGALTLVAALMFIFYFVTGALNWITAGGEQGKIQKARDQMIQGVLGMVVIVIAYSVIGIIGSFLGLKDLLNPATIIINQLNPAGGASSGPGPAPLGPVGGGSL